MGLNAILLGAAVLVSHGALAASFDCDHAVTKMEQMICSDPALSRQDEQLAAVYERALRATSDPEAIRNQQREWLADTARNCDSVACLKSAYTLRINQLGAITPPEAATAPASLVGKRCHVFYGYVVVNPLKSAVASWPDDPRVKKRLTGLDDIKSHDGKVVFKTKYTIDDEPGAYWNDRDVYIVEIGRDYFLVTQEGLARCKVARG